ncbi:hypothetical protein J0910_30580 [Nocardiopsis sp. CNT-189]|uniref:hypothetical protein n=1 Tax=Nocardiopsis oceanisediminis TaxID=2816862 RepID=UPI003B375D7F
MPAGPPPDPPHYEIARYLCEQLEGRGAACRLLHQGGRGAVILLGGPPDTGGPPPLVLTPDPPRHAWFCDRRGRKHRVDLAAEDAVVEILGHHRAP